MQELSEGLIAAYEQAREVVSAAVGIEAAQLAMTAVREAAGPEVYPSLYRLESDRLWLVAQAGYSRVYDGLSLERGVMASAITGGRTRFVADSADEPDFLHAHGQFVSEVAVPVSGHLFNVETRAPLCEEVVAPSEEFARFLVERCAADPSATLSEMSVARALVPMVTLGDRDLIAEYALRLMARHAGLEIAQLALDAGDGSVVSFVWRQPGSAVGPVEGDRVIGLVRRFQPYSVSVGEPAEGFDAWQQLGVFLAAPLVEQGRVIGGIVGAGPGDGAGDTEALASVAAHTAACLARQRLEDQLATALTARGEFIASVSHELRTPLTAIVGYTDLLLEDGADDPAEQREFISAVRDGASHLLELVGDILDVARSEVGKLRVRTDERIPLAPLVEDLAGYLSPLAEERRVKVVSSVPPDVEVRGDEVRVRQVLLNLLSNAVKFTTDGRVEVSVERAEHRVRVRVQDEGVGIDAETLGSLFQPFTGRSVSDPSVGTGLGLVISRRLAEAMGGTVHLSSDGRGKGAIATLELPSA